MANSLYTMDEGSWLSVDKTSGTGRDSVVYSTESWTGREDRLTVRIVRSGKNAKTVTLRQLGVEINDVPTDMLEFPAAGGDKQVLVTTNAASLIALVTSDSSPVNGYIKAFATASGLDINVNDVSLSYGFPGDPGLAAAFEVSLIISMPDNTGREERTEYLTINGVLIKLYQAGTEADYIELDKEFEQISGDETSAELEISSNVDGYTIEIVECEETNESLSVSPTTVYLDSDGSGVSLNVNVEPSTLGWEIISNG